MTMETPPLDEQISSIASVRVLKREYRAQRKAAKRAASAEYWRRVRCFWTWPLRHEWVTYERTDGSTYRACVGCGRPYGG